MPQTTHTHKQANYLGCILMILGMFCFGITNVIAKKTGKVLPLSEIIFFRSLVSSIVMFGYARVTGQKGLLQTSSLSMQLTRGFIGFWQLFFLYWSCVVLPLGDATAISFATTIFVTALSVPLLKEHVGWDGWAAVLVGFAGVFVMSQVTGAVTMVGVTAALISSLFEAIVMILSRILGRKDSPFTTVFIYTLMTCVVGGIIAAFVWVTPTWEQILWLSLLGVAGTTGHLFIATAYQKAMAIVVAPMFYTQIIWGVLFGYMFWGDLPQMTVVMGTPLIILSGLYIMYRENKKKQEHAPEF